MTSPWHSGHPRTKVYHNNKNCPTGPLIPDRLWRAGTEHEQNGRLKLCKHCEDRNKT
jgi:hypothetical protein